MYLVGGIRIDTVVMWGLVVDHGSIGEFRMKFGDKNSYRGQLVSSRA